MNFKDTLIGVLDAIYPKKCAFCSRVINNDDDICDACRKKIVYINSDKRCMKCGLERKHCTCSYRVFHFEKIVCAMSYEDPARQGLLSYKLAERTHIANFLAQKTALCIAQEYDDIYFDMLTVVPTAFNSKLKNGFDHSRLFGKQLADILSIPFAPKAISCFPFAGHQHGKDFKVRMVSVKNKYKCKVDLKGKTVLLIDDVKTTGASLDECAKQLLFAGADRVCCATAFVRLTPYKIERKQGGKRRQVKP